MLQWAYGAPLRMGSSPPFSVVAESLMRRLVRRWGCRAACVCVEPHDDRKGQINRNALLRCCVRRRPP